MVILETIRLELGRLTTHLPIIGFNKTTVDSQGQGVAVLFSSSIGDSIMWWKITKDSIWIRIYQRLLGKERDTVDTQMFSKNNIEYFLGVRMQKNAMLLANAKSNFRAFLAISWKFSDFLEKIFWNLFELKN